MNTATRSAKKKPKPKPKPTYIYLTKDGSIWDTISSTSYLSAGSIVYRVKVSALTKGVVSTVWKD